MVISSCTCWWWCISKHMGIYIIFCVVEIIKKLQCVASNLPVIHWKTRKSDICTTLPMILDMKMSQNIWESTIWMYQLNWKGERIIWLDGTVPYLNKVHIVHSVEVIPGKNQDILNILTSWILQHRSIFYIIAFNTQLAFRFFLAFFMMRKEIAKGK